MHLFICLCRPSGSALWSSEEQVGRPGGSGVLWGVSPLYQYVVQAHQSVPVTSIINVFVGEEVENSTVLSSLHQLRSVTECGGITTFLLIWYFAGGQTDLSQNGVISGEVWQVVSHTCTMTRGLPAADISIPSHRQLQHKNLPLGKYALVYPELTRTPQTRSSVMG